MQFQDDEDGDFLVPGASRSRLSSLFQGDSSSGDVNQALTFTAPKQPKKIENAPGAMKLLHAVAAHAYKLKDGVYSNEGKLGCAILGHHETTSYKLLLYKGKQVQVTVATITPTFNFHVQPNCYANFYDEKKENWSVNFDNESILTDFVKQVILAKANSQGKSVTSLVIQNIVTGEGTALESGDSAEVKHTGWILKDYGFGQMFDSNMSSESYFRFRLGKSKVIKGWNEGLVGAQKGDKRMLVVPPEMAYGADGMGSAVPPNSTLIFEIHTIKVKTVGDSSHSPSPIKIMDSVADKNTEVASRQSFSQDDNIKMRGASISEQLSQSPKKDKAQLISRMAKMGTATLPFHGAIPAQVNSDSESEADLVPEPSPPPLIQNVSRTTSPKPSTKPRSRTTSGTSTTAPQPTQQSIPPTQGSVPFQPPSQVPHYDASVMPAQSPAAFAAMPYPGYPPIPSQYMLQQSSFSMQNVPTMVPSVATSVVETHLPMLISESRNQNTEVRISLSKITDKVDNILNKVDDMRQQGRSPNMSMPFMEGTILVQNIERIVQENMRLKEEVEAKTAKIESLNEKICDLFQRNQRFFEESNTMLEQKSDNLNTVSTQAQEKILSLEQEKARLQLDFSSTSIKLSSLESDLEKYKNIESELNEKLTVVQKDTRLQESLLKEKTNQLEDVEIRLKEMTLVVDKLKTVEQEKNLLSAKIEKLEQGASSTQETNKLIQMYKDEIEQYKVKTQEMDSRVSSIPKLQEEKEKISLELDEAIKLKTELEAKCKDTQKRYEVFQEKTKVLKERYEKQIIELMNELKHVQASKSLSASPDFSAEIKRAMNVLYKILQGKFDANSSYQGSKILSTVLQSILDLTLQILERKKSSPSSGSPSASPKPSKKNQLPKQDNIESPLQSETTTIQNGIQNEETSVSKDVQHDDSASLDRTPVNEAPVEKKEEEESLASNKLDSIANVHISDNKNEELIPNANSDTNSTISEINDGGEVQEVIPKADSDINTQTSESKEPVPKGDGDTQMSESSIKSESPERNTSPNSLFSQPHGAKV